MSDFLANWLQLREPADVAARSASLTDTVARVVATGHDDVRVLDLGTGTGSNLRYLADYLPPRQSWLVVDRDPALLALLPERTADWAASRHRQVETEGSQCVIQGTRLDCRVETRCLDLKTLDALDIFEGSASGDRFCAARPGVGEVAARAGYALSKRRLRGALRPQLQRPVILLASGAGGRHDSWTSEPTSESG